MASVPLPQTKQCTRLRFGLTVSEGRRSSCHGQDAMYSDPALRSSAGLNRSTTRARSRTCSSSAGVITDIRPPGRGPSR